MRLIGLAKVNRSKTAHTKLAHHRPRNLDRTLDIAMDDAFAGPTRRIAYERLLLDLIEGDQTLFVRRDEIEAQWDWIDAIRASWAEHEVKPKPYTAGSWGPSAAIALAERDGVTWHE